jgi:hypothetical protein
VGKREWTESGRVGFELCFLERGFGLRFFCFLCEEEAVCSPQAAEGGTPSGQPAGCRRYYWRFGQPRRLSPQLPCRVQLIRAYYSGDVARCWRERLRHTYIIQDFVQDFQILQTAACVEKNYCVLGCEEASG